MDKGDVMDKLLVSIDDAREILGRRGRSRIYELIKSGDLEFVKDGGRTLIIKASIDRYVEKLRVKHKHTVFTPRQLAANK